MAIEVVMPKLGWTMEEGILAEWIKQDGDRVEPGEIIFTVESDKALQEVEAFDSGILRIPPDSPPVGSTVPVGGLLAYLVEPGEQAPFEKEGGRTTAPDGPAATPQPEQAGEDAQPARAVARRGKNGTPAISPRAKRVAEALGVAWESVEGSGRTGRIVERDVRAAAEQARTAARHAPVTRSAQFIDMTPVARRAADDLGVDVGALAAQLPGKRITREDVERAAATAQPAVIRGADGDGQRTPFAGTRRIIAERMSQSAQTTAPVTLTTEVDATELVKLRQQLKAAGREPVPSYNDLLIKLASVALEAHPALNARLEGGEIVQSRSAHIGLAVDTPRGLLVPVIRNVESKSVRQIARESAELIEATKKGAVKADALAGSTFSISNLGMFEIDAFTPIINLPECAILGVGRIVPKPVVVDVETEQVAVRHMMFLSLTFDHRLVDGAPAARFLQQVMRFIEQPYLWLAG